MSEREVSSEKFHIFNDILNIANSSLNKTHTSIDS